MSASRRRKALGQHFLTDARVADRIVAYANPLATDRVLEIGPGPGVLTHRLAGRVAHLVAVERDPALAHRLRLTLPPGAPVQVEEADATRVDLAQWGPYDKVVANLPYSVSTPITFRLLPIPWRTAILMYQREFADRLAAQDPASDAYGRLGAAVAYYAGVDDLETVPPTAFRPPPKVASGLVRLTRHVRPPFPAAGPDAYLELLRIVFSTRRKTLRATFRRHHRALGFADAGHADQALAAWGRPGARPEEVAPADLGRLSLAIEEHIARERPPHP